MKTTGHRICDVAPNSIAEEVGLETGDRLLAINGRPVVDIIDYIDEMSHESVELTIKKLDGQEWVLDIEKEPYEDLGIEFEQPLLDRQRSCANKCIFCFIDQLPEKMRSTLYYKDDDWRLSFLMGNYITMTNLSSKDIDRIVEKHISPLYVSVHTTNPQLRQKMLRNKRAGEINSIIKRFHEAKILLHCQIVLCPGWNDGIELDRTLKDLWELREIVKSVAVVPVGLTGHRRGLVPIKPFDRESSGQVIEQVDKWQNRCRKEGGTAFVFAADEFYIQAQRRFPPYHSYEDFPQIENGIGLVVRFREEVLNALDESGDGTAKLVCGKKRLSIVTGESAYRFIKSITEIVQEKTGVSVKVYPIRNRFFGGYVTVAGLLTGRDILEGLRNKELGQSVLIPQVMLRKGEDVFLDNMTLKELEKALNVPVVPVPVDGKAFLEKILGR